MPAAAIAPARPDRDARVAVVMSATTAASVVRKVLRRGADAGFNRRMRDLRLLGSLVAVSTLVMAAPSARAESAPFETIWSVRLEGCQETPAVTTSASGSALLRLPNFTGNELSYDLTFTGLTATAVHIHGPAARGATAPVLFTLGTDSPGQGTITLTPEQRSIVEGGLAYVNVHTAAFPDGELRGQIDNRGSACPPPADAGVPDAVGSTDGGLGADAAGTDTDRGGGCATGGSGGGLGVAALALAALVGAGRRRRRA